MTTQERPRKIIHLVPEQEAMLPVYAERWTKIGLSTEPADRPAGEAAIHEIYRCGGWEPPKRIVWCGSPLAMVRLAVKEGASESSQILPTDVQETFQSVDRRILRPVWREVMGGLEDLLSFGFGLQELVVESLIEAHAEVEHWSLFGQFDFGHLAAYEFFAEQCGLMEETAALRGDWALARSAGTALPFRDVCYVSERPNLVGRDPHGRLHAAEGPAITYPDGWSLYVWHGMSIAADIIEKRDEANPADVLAERNAELRRARMEIFEEVHGAGALVREFGTRLLAEDEAHGRPRRLYDVSGLEGARLLMVENGTMEPDGQVRAFSLFVPPEMEAPHEAVAWSYGWPDGRYAEALRT